MLFRSTVYASRRSSKSSSVGGPCSVSAMASPTVVITASSTVDAVGASASVAVTATLLKVCDQDGPVSGRVLGIVPPEASDRIRMAEASGRPCRAWFVDHIPAAESSDGSFQMVLSVWCSSLTTAAGGWRDLTLEELRETVRRAARADGQASAGRAGAWPPAAKPSRAPSRPDSPDKGLTPGQMDRIKDAVRRKLRGEGEEP